MKKTSYIMLIASVLLILFSVISIRFINNKKYNHKAKKTIKIAVVFTGSGLGDKSFNDLIYDGLLKAQEELNIEFDYAEPMYPDKYKQSILEFAETRE
ncbi:MAG: BMP family ABC transporter substrate-binding protein, partial [Clostridium sp.]